MEFTFCISAKAQKSNLAIRDLTSEQTIKKIPVYSVGYMMKISTGILRPFLRIQIDRTTPL